MIRIDVYKAYLDFIMTDVLREVTIVSFFDRSLSNIKAIGASLNYKSDLWYSSENDYNNQERFSLDKNGYQVYIQPIIFGKEKYYHAIAMSKYLNKNRILLQNGEEEEAYYEYLMQHFNLPLMRDWEKELFQDSLGKQLLKKGAHPIKYGNYSFTRCIPVNGKDCKLDQLAVYNSYMSEDALSEMVQYLFNSGKIRICPKPQKQLDFKDMDTYFKKYGPTLVSNLEEKITPLRQLSGDVDNFTLLHKRLYPQQIAQVNGIVSLLKKSSYGIINHGMGTGKTLCAGAVCEGYFVSKWLKGNPRKELKDVYLEENIINYRNIIMCPGHLVKKWAEELKSEIPYANVTIINNFSQLLELRERGAKRNGREYYIISKDFGKLSYQMQPTPTKRRYDRIYYKVCAECGETYFNPGHTCPHCNSREYNLKYSGQSIEGMICPHCNKILLPNRNWMDEDGESGSERVLDYYSFTSQTRANSNCYYCEEPLWKPFVANLGADLKVSKWSRATHYTNKAHKGKKTVWVHTDFTEKYFGRIGEKPLKIKNCDNAKGVRKYSPVEFIKRYLRNFFDIAIFDEAHAYKSGYTGQGHAMHAICKASKKHLALTGTIAGGYASHLFYLLYRLNPRRMIEKGFCYSDELKFTEIYGKTDREFLLGSTPDNDAEFNQCTKGKQVGSVKAKAGISPLIFIDFLLDSTTFLDLSDMSKYLPKLIEKVEVVNPDSELEKQMIRAYQADIRTLKQLSREKGGRGLLSSMLQYSLSYIDKPYGVSPICSPVHGGVLIQPKEYKEFSGLEPDNLTAKEKRLIEIINQEMEEGRNCFVYAEFTGQPETCVTYRLKELIEKYCNLKRKVEVLESSSPVASEREEWIHRKAKEGIKVVITNPMCVETGLDFCFTKDNVQYNYPSIIFFQMGYSLFTNWQASRRGYRLTQTKECRVYYLAVSGTIQVAVIELIAEKQVATAAIQGQFSAEGLSAMANGVDVKVRLAQSLANMDEKSSNHLQEMFDVIHQVETEDSLYHYKPMLILSELIGSGVYSGNRRKGKNTMHNILDTWEFFNFSIPQDEVAVSEISLDDLVHLPKKVAKPKRGRYKRQRLEGQVYLSI